MGRLWPWRDRRERELDAELRDHLERLVADYRRGGLSDAEAHRRAAATFGGLEQTKEYCRDVRPGAWLRDAAMDLRHGLRILSHHRAFTLVAVLSLALGIGATTAIFSLVDAVLLKTLPVHAPRQLALLAEQSDNGLGSSFTMPQYRVFAESRTLTGLCAFRPWPGFRYQSTSGARLAMGQLVSGNCFQVLGLSPFMGRLLSQDDDRGPGGPLVAIVSYSFWQSELAADPRIVGRTLDLMGKPFTIIGVTPPEFHGLEPGRAIDVTVPLSAQAVLLPGTPLLSTPDARWLRLIGRRAGETTNEEVALDLRRRSALMPSPTGPPGARRPVLMVLSGAQGLNDLRRAYSLPLRLLFAGVGVLLLIACVNLAGLLLARSKAREHDISLRLALGASRGRLIRQLLAEALLIACAGSLAGLALSVWGRAAVLAVLSRGRETIALDTRLDARLLAFTVALLAATTLMFGLWPAFQATRRTQLRAATVAGGHRRHTTMLIAAQSALALALVTSGALFFRSLSALQAVDTGFRRDRVLLASVRPATGGVPAEQTTRVYETLYARLSTLPRVRSATLAMDTPLGGRSIMIGVVDRGSQRSASQVHLDIVGPRYLETMGIPILAGRDIRTDDDERARPVAILSASLASRLFGIRNVVGEMVEQGGERLEIVGVAGNVRYEGLKSPPGDAIYRPYTQMSGDWTEQLTFALRTDAAPETLLAAVRREVGEVSRELPIYDVSTLDAQYDAAMTPERLLALISGFIGGFSLLLVAIGVYGALAYAAARRTREMGVRLALGARRFDIVRLMVNGALTPIAAGLAVGVPLALGAGSVIRTTLYGVKAGDVETCAAAGALLLAAGLAAALGPARRAASTDPMAALRDE